MFVPYICCGDPILGFSEKLALALGNYCDVLEIGIPFSDPIADGPTIQAASQRALAQKINPAKAFSLIASLRAKNFQKPIAIMAYYNTLYSFGAEKFVSEMKNAGAGSIIIPDLPFSEDVQFESMCASYGVNIVGMVSPSTPIARAEKIIQSNKAEFTYLVARKGITGVGGGPERDALEFVERIRRVAGGKKICVGFGVSSAGHAAEFVAAGADGVIVGSAIIDIYSGHIADGTPGEHKALDEIAEFARGISEACRRGGKT